jgi:putative MATE family efflux protein
MSQVKKQINNYSISSFKQQLKSLWIDLKDALAGSDRDFTKAPLNRAIFLLAAPMALEMVMESLFALVDIYFVGKLGANAIAIVGTTESMMTIVYAISMGLSMAVTALVSRRIGEKKPEKAALAATQAIIVGLLISIFLAIPGIFFAKDVLRLMGSDPQAIEEGYMYTKIIMSSNVVIMLLFIINAIFRSAGDAAISMRVLWMANIINIVLDPCLILGLGPFPELGIAGAAIATTIGRGLAVLYQIYLLFNGKGRIKLNLKVVRIKVSTMVKLLRLSIGGIGQNLIATSSWVILMKIVNEFGSEAAAGYNIALRIVIFILLPSWGISNAASTLVGQNLGANNADRAERAVWKTAKVNMLYMLFAAIIFVFWPGFFVGFFDQSPAVEAIAKDALWIISIGFIGYGVGMVIVNSFNGSGDTKTPTFINFFAFWVMEIPLAYFLAIKLGLEENGVFWAIVISECTLTLIAYLIFRRGKWKTNKV